MVKGNDRLRQAFGDDCGFEVGGNSKLRVAARSEIPAALDQAVELVPVEGDLGRGAAGLIACGAERCGMAPDGQCMRATESISEGFTHDEVPTR